MGFVLLNVETTQNTVFWDVTSCSYKFTDVSEEYTTSIFRTEEEGTASSSG
jgi:hypothetical protein